jgi:hypothetical protein
MSEIDPTQQCFHLWATAMYCKQMRDRLDNMPESGHLVLGLNDS